MKGSLARFCPVSGGLPMCQFEANLDCKSFLFATIAIADFLACLQQGRGLACQINKVLQRC